MKKSELKQLIKSVLNETISEEARMSASELDSILRHANELKEHGLVTDESNLEDWVKAKLTIANQNLISVFNYLNHEAGNSEENEESGDLDEESKTKSTQNSINPKGKGASGKKAKDNYTQIGVYTTNTNAAQYLSRVRPLVGPRKVSKLPKKK
jgi:hypothetical protein